MVDTPQGPAGPDPSFDPFAGGPERERHDADPLREAASRPAEGAHERRPDEAVSQPWQAGGGEDFLELGGEGVGAPALDDFAGSDPFGSSGGLAESAGRPIEPPRAGAVGVADGFEEPLATDDGIGAAFEDEWSDDALEEDAGWLMEFDDETEGSPLEDGLEAEDEDEGPVAVSGARVWLGRAALVALSLAAGFVMSKALSDGGGDGASEVARSDGAAQGGSWRSGPGGAKGSAPTGAATGAKTDTSVRSAPGGTSADGPLAGSGDPATSTTELETTAQGGAEVEAPVDAQPVVTRPVAKGGGGEGAGEAQDRGAMLDDLLGSDPTRLTSELPPFLQPAPGGEAAETEAPVIETPGGPASGGGLASRRRPGQEPRGLSLPPDDVLALPVVDSPVREATADELAGLWLEPSVPMDRIGDPARLLTPVVGRVRVHLYAGEVFEGSLYAVGERKVWLESSLGRMALEGYQVRRIDRIASEEGAPSLGATGSQDLAGLPRVRVRTPGGVFYGKQLARNGSTVTLITNEGARITLESDQVEAAGTSRTRLIDARGLEAAARNEPQQP